MQRSLTFMAASKISTMPSTLDIQSSGMDLIPNLAPITEKHLFSNPQIVQAKNCAIAEIKMVMSYEATLGMFGSLTTMYSQPKGVALEMFQQQSHFKA